jgi:dipeptidyl aminopeptidase/acylaminoacyl peptidase
VIVVAKGVSPNYFPLNIGDSSDQTFMGDLSAKFIFVFPSFRGEVLNFEGRSFRSDGDRRDALDGATDDALALLNVALQTTPEADPTRICAYGQSRGGNVALLAGIRDPRINCVVDLAGPTDWFYLMGTNGWTEEELWAEAVRTHANVEETGGQNLERFLMRAIEGQADLAAVRHNMIASSPIYFAKRLPAAQLHYGVEDPSVPVVNGLSFVGELKRNKIPRERYEAFFYPGQGHDTDRIAAPIAARAFIAKTLKVK